MKRVLVAALVLLGPASLSAQDAQDVQGVQGVQSVPGIVRTGKWIGAGVFAGSMALALLEHRAADNALDRLRSFCRQASCAIGPDGRYIDPDAESRYAEVVNGDRMARVWLIAGQVTFVATAALFVVELTKDRGTTNIPFSGMVVEPGRIGWRLEF